MKLFETYELRNIFANQIAQIQSAVDQFSNDEIMANDLEVLASNLYEANKIVPIKILGEDLSRRDFKQARIQKFYSAVQRWEGAGWVTVDGFNLIRWFDFSGDALLFQCYASTRLLTSYPEIEVQGNAFKYVAKLDMREASSPDCQARCLKRADEEIDLIKEGLGYVNKEVRDVDRSLRSKILGMLQERKQKVQIFFNAAKLFDVSVEKSPVAKREIVIQKRIVPISHEYKHEETTYCISDANYLEILDTLRHAGASMERTPSSYAAMKEEDLRNVLLTVLNGVYHGKAVGEAFRNQGKTDICIEAENRAAFIAECKMWTGEKKIRDAFLQLDGYSTWRDCKTALIYFVRRKDYLSVLEKMDAAIRDVSEVYEVQEVAKNEFRCRFDSLSSKGQRKDIRVLFFNIYDLAGKAVEDGANA